MKLDQRHGVLEVLALPAATLGSLLIPSSTQTASSASGAGHSSTHAVRTINKDSKLGPEEAAGIESQLTLYQVLKSVITSAGFSLK